MNTAQKVAEWAPPGQLAVAIRLVEGKIHRRWIDQYLPYCAGGRFGGQNDKQYIEGTAFQIVEAKRIGFSYKQIMELVGFTDMHVAISLVTIYELRPAEAMKLYRRSSLELNIWTVRTLISMGVTFDQLPAIERLFKSGRVNSTTFIRYLESAEPDHLVGYFSHMSEGPAQRAKTLAEHKVPFRLAYQLIMRDGVDCEAFGLFYQEVKKNDDVMLDDDVLLQTARRLGPQGLNTMTRLMQYVLSGELSFEQALILSHDFNGPAKWKHFEACFVGLTNDKLTFAELVESLKSLGEETHAAYASLRARNVAHEEAVHRAVLGGMFTHSAEHMRVNGVTFADGLRVHVAGGNLEEFVGAAKYGMTVDEYLEARTH